MITISQETEVRIKKIQLYFEMPNLSGVTWLTTHRAKRLEGVDLPGPEKVRW
jgi:hypothetical protein